MLARILSTSSYGATGEIPPVLVIRIVPSQSFSVRTPMAASSSPMMLTSAISGTLESVKSPSASNVAAISFSTEFFAPGIATSPWRGPDRRIRIRSSFMASFSMP